VLHGDHRSTPTGQTAPPVTPTPPAGTHSGPGESSGA